MFGHQNSDDEQQNGQQDGSSFAAPQPNDYNPALPANDPVVDTQVEETVTPSTDEPVADSAVVTPDEAVVAPNNNDLLDIKQKALSQLSPLIDHLEQSPEEKFRTTMMMIQASDNQELVSEAFKAAQAIPDEKAKAQALLDIVNEINYFTQHHQA